MPRYAFEDFAPGSADLPGRLAVDKDEVIAFARAFDPQPFHVDEEAARQSFAGRLIASGWHSCGSSPTASSSIRPPWARPASRRRSG